MVHWPLDQDQVCIQWQEHFMCERAAHRTLNDHLLMLVHLLKVWLQVYLNVFELEQQRHKSKPLTDSYVTSELITAEILNVLVVSQIHC